MARRKRTRRKSAPAAIVVRQAAPVARRRRSGGGGRVIVGRVARRAPRSNPVVGRAVKSLVSSGVAAGAGALMAWGVQGEKIPQRIAGLETNFVAGLALSLVPVVLPGTVGRVIGEAGSAFSAISAYKLTLGTKLYIADVSTGWDGGDSGY